MCATADSGFECVVERVPERVLEREVIIACKTLKTEIEHLSRIHNIERKTIWLESKLHDIPVKLTAAIQEAIDSIDDADRVLLGLANCGNAVQNVRSGNFELIVPRIDDCVSLVIGSQELRAEIATKWRTLFYTDGWMDNGLNIVDEYYEYVEQKGEKRAKKIYDMMYAHYENLTFIDTGLYDVEAYLERTRPLSEFCNLNQRVEQGTLSYLEHLILGPWSDKLFVTVGPYEQIPADPFLQPGAVC